MGLDIGFQEPGELLLVALVVLPAVPDLDEAILLF
jgi:hypothetical protein